MANGLETAANGESGASTGTPSSHETRNASGSAAATQAHQRQRGDGSDPVGVSSRMKPMQPSPGTKVAEASAARWLAAGRGAGRARSAYRAYPSAALVSACGTSPKASSSQPTGWRGRWLASTAPAVARSEEHTSELQSRPHLVCRLLLEK